MDASTSAQRTSTICRHSPPKSVFGVLVPPALNATSWMLPSMWATIGPATRSDRTSPHGTPNREHAKGRQDPQRHRDQSLQEHHGEGLVDVMPSGLRTALLGAGQRRLFLDLFGRAPSAFVRGIRQGHRLFSTHGLEVIQSTHDPRQNDVLGHACDKSCLFHSFPFGTSK